MADIALNLVVIRSSDLELSARFYAAVGIQLKREQHGNGPEHLATEIGTTVFEVYPFGDTDTVGTTAVRIGFRVLSVAAALKAIEAVGGSVVTPIRESQWGLRAVVADPDGHRIELVEKPRQSIK